MGARYDPDFTVSEDDLRRLHRSVLLLEALTEGLCRAKMVVVGEDRHSWPRSLDR